MTRVKRGTLKNKRRSKIIKLAKGYTNSRKSKFKQAKQAVIKAGTHAYSHRRKKKREMRKLWQIKISGAVKEHGLSYSKFIDLLTKKGFGINRKMLSEIIQESPESFAKIVAQVK